MPDAPEFLASGSVVVAFSNVPGPQLGAGFRETALTLLFKDCLKQSNGMAGGGGGVETLVAIGLLMAVSIHIVPAFFGLPFLPRFLSALRLGQAPPLGGGQKAGSVEAGP